MYEILNLKRMFSTFQETVWSHLNIDCACEIDSGNSERMWIASSNCREWWWIWNLVRFAGSDGWSSLNTVELLVSSIFDGGKWVWNFAQSEECSCVRPVRLVVWNDDLVEEGWETWLTLAEERCEFFHHSGWCLRKGKGEVVGPMAIGCV